MENQETRSEAMEDVQSTLPSERDARQGLGFFAAEALNAYELITLQQPNSWITGFLKYEKRDAKLAVRTFVPIIVVAGGLLTILAATYTKVDLTDL
nr:unnamed protein product [Haemonchus contortus]